MQLLQLPTTESITSGGLHQAPQPRASTNSLTKYQKYIIISTLLKLPQ